MVDLDTLAAVILSNSAVQISLIRHLRRAGILTEADEAELFEQALLLLETQQASISEKADDVFSAARELIEEHLRRKPQR